LTSIAAYSLGREHAAYSSFPCCLFYAVVKVHPREKNKIGGDKEDRTPDLLLARQALSQLSYAPT
jgi:hypothetical protein